jgi:hypothetical protein
MGEAGLREASRVGQVIDTEGVRSTRKRHS